MKHIVLVGACYLDTILTVPFYPEEDSKLRAKSLTTRRGGNCPNTLEVLYQLLQLRSTQDTRTHLISCLPRSDSPATARILSSFGDGAEHAIDFSTCIYREASSDAASSYIIRSEATGSRTLVNFNDIEEMTVGEFAAVAGGFNPDEASWWHFEGRIPDTTVQCIRHIRCTLPKAKVSVEVEKPGREGLTALAAAADVVVYSRSWAESRGHMDAVACLGHEAPNTASLALCTWGAQGAAALCPPDKQYFECPVKPDGGVNVVDTVGAGDTFIAGMLYGLVCQANAWDTATKLGFAVDLATHKVQREGFGGVAQDVKDRL